MARWHVPDIFVDTENINDYGEEVRNDVSDNSIGVAALEMSQSL